MQLEKEEHEVSAKSPANQVLDAVERRGGVLVVRDTPEFKRKTNCGLRDELVLEGARNARNQGLLKLKTTNGSTKIRRTSKRR